MAGTRLWISVVFAIQVASLIVLSVIWTLAKGFVNEKEDLIVTWFRLLLISRNNNENNKTATTNLDWMKQVLESTKSIPSLPPLYINTPHVEEWKELSQKYKDILSMVPSYNTNNNSLENDYDLRELPQSGGTLVECQISIDNNNQLVLFQSQDDQDSRNHCRRQLLPTTTPEKWPMTMCWQPSLDFHFLLVLDDKDYHHSWNLWLDSFQNVRERYGIHSLFPIRPSWTKIQVEFVSHLDFTSTTTTSTDTNQSSLLLSLNQIHDFFQSRHKMHPAARHSIPIYFLVQPAAELAIHLAAPTHPEDEENKQDFEENKLAIFVESANPASLFVVLPQIQDASMARQHARDILQHISTWITLSCLGLDKKLFSLSFDTTLPPVDHANQTINPSFQDLVLPSWLVKLFWRRAIKPSYHEAWEQAQDAVHRYQVAQEQHPQSWVPLHRGEKAWYEEILPPSLLQSLVPAPEPNVALKSLNRLLEARSLIQSGRMSEAMTVLINNRPPPTPLLRRLILDFSFDQYAAILIPLWLPLVLPAFLSLVREIVRYWKLRKNKT